MGKHLFKINFLGGFTRYVVAANSREVDAYLEKSGIQWHSYTCVAGNTKDEVANNRQLIIL